MDAILGGAFRFVMYVLFGLGLETLFAVDGIDRALGFRVERRVPRKYLEGFVSVYMIPLHGFGLLFALEPVSQAIASWAWPLRFVVYAALITTGEAVWGWVLDKTIGFYTWDYYARSKYRVFRRGYTLWTLVPLWGVAGMVLEQYMGLMVRLTPHAVAFFRG
jgi:uncharacterized membrane protein